ncbi:MAG: archease [Thermosulfidibacteraceae bacterium]
MGYKLINPKADIGIEVWGKDEKELIEESIRALLDLIEIDRSQIGEKDSMTVEIESIDSEDLLISTLNTVIYLLDAKKFAIKDFQIENLDLKNYRVKIKFIGEKWKENKDYGITREIKAATYHNISIKREKGVLKTEIIFDV